MAGSSTHEYNAVTFQPVKNPELVFGETPVGTTCLFCQNTIVTKIDYVDGTLTYLAASVICGVGCWFGCCLIPFYIRSCKDVLHLCPYCGSAVGKYNRLC
ncbi:lipopolysaccharide-induced tumor necrosis factor-alpha factor homolog [Dendronephthya gigantea]|uniref:lipopolysaccharide-induced tumor necrosis factor-alpha factor homolog n=1 Tax=Dendronephthya gigantea TaxID=151771 RepID=UPI001069EA23|nr:lipopolysaccharide-induced tumor necrosis factor-alpha factor homolog [Dendronephthya gigantea]